MTVETFSPQPVKLTTAALAKVATLTIKNKESQANFRIYVEGGGCSGFSYCFKLNTQVMEDDTCIKQNGVMVVIDPLSLQYLAGSEVDYKEDLQGKQFFVNNPNATATCGCGHSFSI